MKPDSEQQRYLSLGLPQLPAEKQGCFIRIQRCFVSTQRRKCCGQEALRLPFLPPVAGAAGEAERCFISTNRTLEIARGPVCVSCKRYLQNSQCASRSFATRNYAHLRQMM